LPQLARSIEKVSVVEPRPNPETVAALHEIAWRVASAEGTRTAGLDGKAATIATFVSLSFSAVAAARSLEPTEHLGLDSAYVERLPSWRYVSQRPDQVQGEAIAGLVRAIANERMLNERKALRIRLALRLMVVGLVLIGGEAATLAANEML
jgi:hypothetical protein